MRRFGFIVAAVVCVLCVAVPAVRAEPALAVIVHPQGAAQLTAEDVANIFLKKRRFWADGQPIVALNLPPGSVLREGFSRAVLGSDSSHLAAYWNQQYFQGVFPPVTLSSSAAVKRYVATERNAIGYIDAAEVDDSVRVMLRLP